MDRDSCAGRSEGWIGSYVENGLPVPLIFFPAATNELSGCAPVPAAAPSRRWGGCPRLCRKLTPPRPPPALLFSFPLCVMCARCSFVTAIKSCRSFLPLLPALLPSPVPQCCRSSRVPASPPPPVPERSPERIAVRWHLSALTAPSG